MRLFKHLDCICPTPPPCPIPPYPIENKIRQKQCQGNQTQTQGDLTETLGDLSASQGEQNQTQGDFTETLGDLSASQGDQTQTQGDQSQGDLTQSLTGHGGQTQGDQTLTNTPSISTPVNVSGVNVNVSVSCCDEHKKCFYDCRAECRKCIATMLSLVNNFSLTITDPNDSLISFYSDGLSATPTVGNLNGMTDCTFTIAPESGGNDITICIEALDALSFEPTDTTPNLFSLLQTYLQSLPAYTDNQECSDQHCSSSCYSCYVEVLRLLQTYYTAQSLVQINLAQISQTGYIYKISNCIVYLVDDLTSPTIIYAIPTCKILSCQLQ